MIVASIVVLGVCTLSVPATNFAHAQTSTANAEQIRILTQMILQLQQMLAQLQQGVSRTAPVQVAETKSQTVDLRMGVSEIGTVSSDTYTGNVHDEYWITVHPSNGYVGTCTLKGYYTEGTSKVSAPFKRVVDTSNPDDYWRLAIDAVGKYGVLEEVAVACTTKKGTVRDSIDVNIVGTSGYERLAPLKITLNGETIESSSSVTEVQAVSKCKATYNDYQTYSFDYGDVLKCYWDGEMFEMVDQWKG